MQWFLPLTAILAVLPTFTIQQCITADDTQVNTDPSARFALGKGQLEFSLNLLRLVNSLGTSTNSFFSPSSIYNALTVAYFIANNHTEQSVKKALSIPPTLDKLSTMQAYRLSKFLQQMRNLNGSSSYQQANANRLFVAPKHQIRDCMKDLFQDEISNVDFRKNPVAALQQINQWVEGQTKNQIKDFLKPGQVTQNTDLVLANAAYFKGVWKSKFLAENTKKDDFYVTPSQKTTANMMRQKATFNHLVSERLGAQVLELPYKGEDVSMFILLPPYLGPNGITDILSRLNVDELQKLVSEDTLIPRPVEVVMPKFTLEQELPLDQVLEKLGVGDLFKETADLSGLTGRPEIFFDGAIHKAKVKVDEEGTTAAAATAMFNFRSSRPLDPAKFICNHPFIYFLYDRLSLNIIFAGVFHNPDGTS